MNVLFAIPPWSFPEIYPASMSRAGGPLGDRFGTITGATEPLGMLYMAAVLRRGGFRPAVQDGFNMQPADWLNGIIDAHPDVLALTLSAFSWGKVQPLIPRIREALPDLTIVLGGPYPTAVGPKALESMPQADFVVQGPGETAMLALCQRLAAGTDVSGIPGLCWRHEGGIGCTPKGPVPVLDDLPFPARDLVDMSKYRPSVGFYNRLPSASVITTRGCPRNCSFCVSDSRIAYRSVPSVLAEIEECAVRYGVRHIVFWDEDIAIRRDRLLELCEGLARAKHKVTWCASMTIDEVRPDVLKAMKRAGCWKILFGLESGVPKNLATCNKNLDPAMVRSQLALVRAAGIESFATFMFGIPGETRAEAEETIRFATSLPLDYALFLNFTPFPGTGFYDHIEDHGTFQGVWSTQAISFVPHSMTLDDLKELRVLAYRRFYLRPSYILRRALTMRSPEDVLRNLKGLAATLGMKTEGII
jgi:radical SAM superfamily enzyme YgiQ (UPF0313 family)